jgi:hypothetical protein
MNKYVRFLNGDCYGRNISFYINGKLSAENIPFGKASRYIAIDGSSASFSLSCLNCDVSECSALELNFDNSPVYTVAAVCIADSVCLYGIREMFGEPSRTTANMRVCNLSPDISGEDLYANRYKLIGDIDYLEISKYIPVIPDTYDFSIRNDENVVFNIGRQTLQKGKYNTFYIMGKHNSNPAMRCIVSVDGMSYEGEWL